MKVKLFLGSMSPAPFPTPLGCCHYYLWGLPAALCTSNFCTTRHAIGSMASTYQWFHFHPGNTLWWISGPSASPLLRIPLFCEPWFAHSGNFLSLFCLASAEKFCKTHQLYLSRKIFLISDLPRTQRRLDPHAQGPTKESFRRYLKRMTP